MLLFLILILYDFGLDYQFTALSLITRHTYLQDTTQSTEADMSKVEMEGDVLRNSQITEEALYLTADPANVEDMEKLLPTEVIIERMLSWF